MKQLSQLDRIEAMLRLQLTNSGSLHTIGGYVCGRTSEDKAYVILYPAADYMDKKAVRVYEENFHKLPDFLSLSPDEIEDDADGGNPEKEKAKRKGWYRECAQQFDVLIAEGRMTDLGKREKRFLRVLRVYPPRTSPPPPQGSPTPANATPPRGIHESPPRREPPSPPATGGRGDEPATKKEQERAFYLNECRTSDSEFLFTTAFRKTFSDVSEGSLAKTIQVILSDYQPVSADEAEFSFYAPALTNAAAAYWDARRAGKDHKAALTLAKKAWGETK